MYTELMTLTFGHSSRVNFFFLWKIDQILNRTTFDERNGGSYFQQNLAQIRFHPHDKQVTIKTKHMYRFLVVPSTLLPPKIPIKVPVRGNVNGGSRSEQILTILGFRKRRLRGAISRIWLEKQRSPVKTDLAR